MTAQNNLEFSGRHRFFITILGLLFLGVMVRATYLHVINNDFLRKEGDARILRKEVIPAHRGILRDRNGQPLAVSTPVTTLWMNPKKINAEDIPRLAKALDVKPDVLAARIKANARKEFYYLRRHMAPADADAVLSQDIAGVYSQTEYHRFYPEGEVASQVLGFTNLEDRGQEGLELELDEQLRGVPGERRVLRDLKGRKVKDVALVSAAQPGKDIYLSFDSRTQYLAYRELADAVAKNGAAAGTAVALNVETGEVLAMVNQPSFNPNNRTNLKPAEMRNRAVVDMFEPGSTVKPFTMLAALESGKFTARSQFNTNPGTFRVYDKVVRDTHNYGVVDMQMAITKSSNVAMAQVAGALPKETLPTFFSRMGFGRSLQSGFPGESAGMLQPPSQWRPVELATMSYGYGIAVTALQLAHAYATLASGGIERPVSFLKVEGPVEGKRVLDEKITHQIIPMMESVVTSDGTAIRAAVPGYRVAGKTGTAHKPKKDSRGYETGQYMSTFAGMAPASRPKVVLVVVIDSPSNGQYYGGLVSAPVFSRIMAETLRLMNVEPDNSAEHLAQQGSVPAVRPVPQNGRGA